MQQLRDKEAQKYFNSLPPRKYDIVLILENIQYAKNVANIFRSAESADVKKIYLTGISKKPPFGKGLQKVSRGSETKVEHEYVTNTLEILPKLKGENYHIMALEVTDKHVFHSDLKRYLGDKKKICFIAGNEDSGVNRTTLEQCDSAVTILMYGKNPSLNVNVSVGIVLFSF
ncbi:TrmH family RNA methyltransferase [Patescibacteria group bacterium]|nr:TrmH family RNA methyltransferase [Patescibacteria group bacterium]